MNFTFLHDLLSSPWQLEANTFHSVYPIFNGILNGLSFEKGEEPENTKPFLIHQNTTIQGNQKPNQEISVLPVRGVLTKHDQYCGNVGTRTLAERLSLADKKKEVIGHILLIESGGGQSIAVPELSDVMIACTKPIIAFIDGIAASAAYYIASFSNEIIASRDTDLIGCIGTMVEYRGRKSISKEDSNQEVSIRIYANEAEEKNKEYEEAINNANVELVKERILNPINEKFVSDIKTNRKNVSAEHLKGKTFFASEVVGSLIDSIGSFELAVSRVQELAKENNELEFNQKHKNQKTMNDFKQLKSVLNTANFEQSKEGVYLTEEQLLEVETALEEATKEGKELQEVKRLLEEEKATSSQWMKEKESLQNTVNNLNKEVEELKKNPGTNGASVNVENDDDNSETEVTIAKGDNLAEDILNVRKNYMEE